MEKLSDRIQTIINTLTKKVSSMEETPKDCASYTSFIGDLYIHYNTVKRMETICPDNTAYFEKETIFVLRIEKELYAILPE